LVVLAVAVAVASALSGPGVAFVRLAAYGCFCGSRGYGAPDLCFGQVGK
jgi:hypothetical protein